MRKMTAPLRGALAGTVATVLMSGLMLAGQRAGLLGQMPPEKITARSLHRLKLRPDKRQTRAAAAGAHLAFGVAGGSIFAVLVRRGPAGSRVVQGLVYATGIWAVSYLGWIPALGLMAPAHRDRPGRPQVMLAAHLVYGAALGLLLQRPPKRSDPGVNQPLA